MVDIALILETLDNELNHTYRIISLQDAASNIMINCPYHDDRSPSFGILKEDKMQGNKLIRAGHGHCFACSASANLPSVISHMFGHEDGGKFGAEWLLERFGITGEHQINFRKTNYVASVPKVVPYEDYVTYHPYMETRGIRKDTAELFQLGYNPRTDSIVMPVFDKFGVNRMNVERGVTRKSFHNTPGADKDNLLFGLSQYYALLESTRKDTLYIVESAIDAMLLWQEGKMAVALLQSVPMPGQLKLIEATYAKNIVIATDNDEAGDKAVQPFLNHTLKSVYRTVFPKGTNDIGDFTVEQIRGMKVIEKKRLRGDETPFRNPFKIGSTW